MPPRGDLASWSLLAILGLPWLGAVVVAALPRERQHLAGKITLLALVAGAASLAISRLFGSNLTLDLPWIPAMTLSLSLRLDPVALPFLVNTLGVALAAAWYAQGYFAHIERAPLCYGLLLAFSGSMVGTLLANDAILFFVFWELMLVTSSLLLAGWGDGKNVGAVTIKYFVYTQLGSLLVLIALVWLIATTGQSSLAGITAGIAKVTPSGLTWIAGLFIAGFAVKLAIAPLHTWLPDAHSIAPMPVTVLLAAAMLSMGAYGMLRYPIMLLGQSAIKSLQLPLLIIALASQIYGALMSLSSTDIKRLVAYSSVSQMGYVLFGLATLTPRGMAGGVLHVISHGILKAALFMGVGLVMWGTERRRLDRLGGLWGEMPGASVVLALTAIAMAGLPPFVAFHGEWMILAGGLAASHPILGYLAFISPLFTAAYGLWLITRVALGPRPLDLEVHPVPRSMRWSTYALVALSLVLGLFPNIVYRWATEAVSAIACRVEL